MYVPTRLMRVLRVCVVFNEKQRPSEKHAFMFSMFSFLQFIFGPLFGVLSQAPVLARYIRTCRNYCIVGNFHSKNEKLQIEFFTDDGHSHVIEHKNA